MTSFLQSEQWMNFQKSLGRKVFRIDETNVIKHDLPFGKSYLYIPALAGMTNDELRMTKEIAKRENSIFIKAEPLEDTIAQGLVRSGFQKSSKNIQPHKTVLLDLTRSEDELLGAMHHKTRYNIKVAEKNGIHVTCSTNHETDIEIFWNLMQKTTQRDKFNAHPKEYYECLISYFPYGKYVATSLWFAYHNDTPVAAAIILTCGDRAYYLHGASDHEYRNLMAPYALHWEIAISYKLKAISSYDFWGIDSARWPGVTRFKLGWGGRTIEYPGAFDLAISRPWKFLYDLKNLVK